MALCARRDNPLIKMHHQLVGIYWWKNSINKNLMVAIPIGKRQSITNERIREKYYWSNKTLNRYLTETDLLSNKEVLRFLDSIPREHRGEVVDKN